MKAKNKKIASFKIELIYILAFVLWILATYEILIKVGL